MSTIADKIEQFDGALKVRDLARELRLHPITVYRLAHAGKLPHFRIASSIRFCPRTLAAYLRKHEVGR